MSTIYFVNTFDVDSYLTESQGSQVNFEVLNSFNVRDKLENFTNKNQTSHKQERKFVKYNTESDSKFKLNNPTQLKELDNSKNENLKLNQIEDNSFIQTTDQIKEVNFKSILKIHPKYPRLSRQKSEEGQVKIYVKYNKLGVILDKKIFESSGFNRLDHAAFESINDRLEFKDDVVDSKLDQREIIIIFNFTLI